MATFYAASSDGEDDEEHFFDAQPTRVETDLQALRPAEGRPGMRMTRSDSDWTRQSDQPPAAPQASNSLHDRNSRLLRPATSDGRISTGTQKRHSLYEPVPAIPPIPARFLENGRPASVIVASPRRAHTDDNLRRASTNFAQYSQPPDRRVARPSTSYGEFAANTKRARPPPPASHSSYGVSNDAGPPPALDTQKLLSPEIARRKSSPSLPPQFHQQTLTQLEIPRAAMNGRTGAPRRQSRAKKDEDLFMELAQDSSGVDDEVRPPSRSERAASRLSHGKRRSLPAESMLNNASAERRPKSSGNIFGRPASRIGEFPSDLQRHVERYRNTPSRGSFRPEDVVSTSGRSLSGRQQRFSAAPERSPMSPSRFAERIRSPELPHYGRRRPSFGVAEAQSRQNRPSNKAQDSQDESPADSSEPKRSNPDTASVESTADTVWDELDDLKSRIKKLELTGKLPPTSGAAVSGSSSERPRTATTAPTTIDSSPKHERKPEVEPVQAQPPPENTVGGPSAANIHPLLHAALAKAKQLLNATLYRSLEATASDALQLAAMTGSAGPQGTAFSAASIINGVTVSDRHVRRKADTMCRNLTDLCLALCDGKHEAPSITSSPITLNVPAQGSPSIRHSRSSLGPNEGPSRANSQTRPMSRLEARRSSMLGIQASNSRDSGADDVSASEHESTPSQPAKQQELRRTSRTSSRLLNARLPRYEEASGDEDPTIRPPSRAMTDIGGSGLRTKPNGPRDFSPRAEPSPSLREALATRRANSGAHESNQHLSRVSSDTSRRRFLEPSTPAVVEEEGSTGLEYHQASPSSAAAQPRRRITSLGQFSARRGASAAAASEAPSRATSLQQRRHVVVE